MSAEQKKFKGWNVTEAASRCVDTALRDQLEQARELWRKAGSRTTRPTVYSFWNQESERHGSERSAKQLAGWQAYVAFKTVNKNYNQRLRELLLNPRLFAWGRVGQPTAEFQHLAASAWSKLKFSRDPSVVIQPDGTRIYDVSIFPPIYDEAAPTALSHLSLREAFFEFILRDPEVQKLGADVIGSIGHKEVFEGGTAPGATVNFLWKLAADARELAHDFMRCGVVVIGEPLSIASPVIEYVSEALHDRIQALHLILSRGPIICRGTFVQTGVEQNIPRVQWLRDSIYVDVKNGDVCEIVDGKRITLWSGVQLLREDLAATTPVNPTETAASIRVRSSNKTKTECIRWLIEEMRKSPNSKPKPKAQYWREAQARFGPSLSYGAFKEAWSYAAHETPALAWSAPGAPRKSA